MLAENPAENILGAADTGVLQLGPLGWVIKIKKDCVEYMVK